VVVPAVERRQAAADGWPDLLVMWFGPGLAAVAVRGMLD
jgi:hypothetical protein